MNCCLIFLFKKKTKEEKIEGHGILPHDNYQHPLDDHDTTKEFLAPTILDTLKVAIEREYGILFFNFFVVFLCVDVSVCLCVCVIKLVVL